MSSQKVEFPCPVCGNTNYKVMFPDTLGERLPAFDYNFTKNYNLTYRIVECTQCSHHYASPRAANIWSNYSGDHEDSIYLENQDQRIATSHEVLKKIRRYKEKGKLLDVGCATGDFLIAAREYYDVEGLELSKWSGKMAEERGFKIHRKLLDEMDKSEFYDLVTLWGVIEHFEYPAAEINNISRLLKKGGLVCLWTGDVSAITAKLLKKKWWYYQGQHIQMFTEKSICKLFEANGFKKTYIGYYPYVITSNSLRNSISRYPFILKLARPILRSKYFTDLKFVLKLPGEMFAIFEKQ